MNEQTTNMTTAKSLIANHGYTQDEFLVLVNRIAKQRGMEPRTRPRLGAVLNGKTTSGPFYDCVVDAINEVFNVTITEKNHG